MNKDIVAGVIRHLLTTLGGAGIFSDDELTMIAGAVSVLVGFLWSAWIKRKVDDNPISPMGS